MHQINSGDLVSVIPRRNYTFLCCERVGPVQGSKSPKSGKEGFGVKKLPFPSASEKGDLSQKIPIFPVEPCREMGIFWRIGKWEFFDPEPSFPYFGDFDPCTGPTRSQFLCCPSQEGAHNRLHQNILRELVGVKNSPLLHQKILGELICNPKGPNGTLSALAVAVALHCHPRSPRECHHPPVFQGEIIYPSLRPFFAKTHSPMEGGWGCIFLRPHAAGIFFMHPFDTPPPPPPEGYSQGRGG